MLLRQLPRGPSPHRCCVMQFLVPGLSTLTFKSWVSLFPQSRPQGLKQLLAFSYRSERMVTIPFTKLIVTGKC
ncbi:hypothetical protein BV22DRAFT_926659 [Leucogyrophana mollusca]|uniref:Uncharacterized protein n=1 Tax=Leucogyrophana mollusca TaxID=85980 RepID=A0ACB8AX33_9AGAM|nr:hypothetical protein BV22DRAFT_926659 [Leucogyrophana mollusca]